MASGSRCCLHDKEFTSVHKSYNYDYHPECRTCNFLGTMPKPLEASSRPGLVGTPAAIVSPTRGEVPVRAVLFKFCSHIMTRHDIYEFHCTYILHINSITALFTMSLRELVVAKSTELKPSLLVLAFAIN